MIRKQLIRSNHRNDMSPWDNAAWEQWLHPHGSRVASSGPAYHAERWGANWSHIRRTHCLLKFLFRKDFNTRGRNVYVRKENGGKSFLSCSYMTGLKSSHQEWRKLKNCKDRTQRSILFFAEEIDEMKFKTCYSSLKRDLD